MKVVALHHDLNKLLDLASRGDREAQRALYHRYAPRLLSICRQYIVDLQKAEDVMVTVFMKVLTKLDTFENKGSFEGWIHRIAVNESLSFIRANSKVKFVEESEIMIESGHDTDMGLIVEDIQQMIDQLPHGCKMVFNLFAIEGYKHQEIAQLLSISENTSKSQYAYAKKLLQHAIHKNNNAQHG